MTDDRKITDCYAIVVDGKAVQVRFSYAVAKIEAGTRRGKICSAKLVWRDVDAPVPRVPPNPEEEKLDADGMERAFNG